jgi:hypothetical protein
MFWFNLIEIYLLKRGNTNIAVELLALVLHIRVVPSSNLSQAVGYSEVFYCTQYL